MYPIAVMLSFVLKKWQYVFIRFLVFVYQEKLGFIVASGFKWDSGFLSKFPAEQNIA